MCQWSFHLVVHSYAQQRQRDALNYTRQLSRFRGRTCERRAVVCYGSNIGELPQEITQIQELLKRAELLRSAAANRES